MPISAKKLSLVHIAKSRLRLGDEAYRAVLWGAAEVESAAELDEYGFEAVMDRFRQLGFESDFHARGMGERVGMASDKQLELIRTLWAEYTDNQGTDASLGKWLDRIFKVSALRFVTYEIAPKAIAALNKMNARKAAK